MTIIPRSLRASGPALTSGKQCSRPLERMASSSPPSYESSRGMLIPRLLSLDDERAQPAPR
jgi:hypothetical protein